MSQDVIGMILKYAIPALMGLGVVSLWVGSLRRVLREVADILVKVDEALDDDTITKDEVAEIIKEAKDVWEAVKSFGKKPDQG